MRKTFTLFGLTQVFEVDHGGLGGWPRRVATSDQIRSDQDKIHFLIQLDIRHNMDHFSEKFLSLLQSIRLSLSYFYLFVGLSVLHSVRSFYQSPFFDSVSLSLCLRLVYISFFFLSLSTQFSPIFDSLSLSLSLSVFAFCVRNFFQSFSLTLFLPLFHTFLFLSLSCITFSLSLYYSPIIDPVSLSFFCLLLCFVFLFTQSFSAFMLQDDFYFLKGYPS